MTATAPAPPGGRRAGPGRRPGPGDATTTTTAVDDEEALDEDSLGEGHATPGGGEGGDDADAAAFPVVASAQGPRSPLSRPSAAA